MASANDDDIDLALAAKKHYDLQLSGYLGRARRAAENNRHLPAAATWADLAAFLPDDIAGHGGLDYALGLLTSALARIVDHEGPPL